MATSCVRLVLLLLLAFGQHAKACSFRGSSRVKPSFELADDFPKSRKDSYQPIYPKHASSESQKPIVKSSAGGYVGSYGRPLYRHSPGSVSQYGSGQQPHYQTNPNTNDGPKMRPRMWYFADPVTGERIEPPVVCPHSRKSTEQQSQKTKDHQAAPQQTPSYLAVSHPHPIQSYPANPKQPSNRPVMPQLQPNYGVAQTKAGTWDFPVVKASVLRPRWRQQMPLYKRLHRPQQWT